MQSVSELRLEPWVPSSSSGSPTSIFNYCTLSSLEILKSQARSFGDKRLIFHFEFLTAQALMLLSLFQFSCLLLSEMSTPHLCPFRSFFSFIPQLKTPEASELHAKPFPPLPEPTDYIYPASLALRGGHVTIV